MVWAAQLATGALLAVVSEWAGRTSVNTRLRMPLSMPLSFLVAPALRFLLPMAGRATLRIAAGAAV